MKKKICNPEQLISAYEMQFESGPAKGKSVILVHNGGLEVMFSKTNGLDILYAKYNGKNICLHAICIGIYTQQQV